MFTEMLASNSSSGGGINNILGILYITYGGGGAIKLINNDYFTLTSGSMPTNGTNVNVTFTANKTFDMRYHRTSGGYAIDITVNGVTTSLTNTDATYDFHIEAGQTMTIQHQNTYGRMNYAFIINENNLS